VQGAGCRSLGVQVAGHWSLVIGGCRVQVAGFRCAIGIPSEPTARVSGMSFSLKSSILFYGAGWPEQDILFRYYLSFTTCHF